MATYDGMRQNNQPPQEEPFTAEGVMRGRAVPRVDGLGQGRGMGLNNIVNQQVSQQGLGLPDPRVIAEGLLAGTITEADLAQMPQELAMRAVELASQASNPRPTVPPNELEMLR